MVKYTSVVLLAGLVSTAVYALPVAEQTSAVSSRDVVGVHAEVYEQGDVPAVEELAMADDAATHDGQAVPLTIPTEDGWKIVNSPRNTMDDKSSCFNLDKDHKHGHITRQAINDKDDYCHGWSTKQNGHLVARNGNDDKNDYCHGWGTKQHDHLVARDGTDDKNDYCHGWGTKQGGHPMTARDIAGGKKGPCCCDKPPKKEEPGLIASTYEAVLAKEKQQNGGN